MEIKFSINMYDQWGDTFDHCILLHLGKKGETILRFDDLYELNEFALSLRGTTIPEIIEHHLDELSESDQAEFGE